MYTANQRKAKMAKFDEMRAGKEGLSDLTLENRAREAGMLSRA